MDREILGAICALVLFLILFISIAPYLSDLQTVNRAKDIVDTAKDGDIETATDEWVDLTVDTVESSIWSALWAPIIGLILGGLIALYAFLRRHS